MCVMYIALSLLGTNYEDSVKIEIDDDNEENENNNVVPSTDSTLSKIKRRMNPLSKLINSIFFTLARTLLGIKNKLTL